MLVGKRKTNAPILFLTAKGQESDKTLGFSSGGDDYLTKPFSYNELNARVKAFLDVIMFIKEKKGMKKIRYRSLVI